MDDMYAEIDVCVGHIVLRINGHCENIRISDRALRRYFRDTEAIIVRESMELPEWISALKMAMLIVIVPFLENEVMKNNPYIMGLLSRARATNGKYRRIVYFPFTGGIEYALAQQHYIGESDAGPSFG
jgi:hypothetical protein